MDSAQNRWWLLPPMQPDVQSVGSLVVAFSPVPQVGESKGGQLPKSRKALADLGSWGHVRGFLLLGARAGPLVFYRFLASPGRRKPASLRESATRFTRHNCGSATRLPQCPFCPFRPRPFSLFFCSRHTLCFSFGASLPSVLVSTYLPFLFKRFRFRFRVFCKDFVLLSLSRLSRL